MNLTYDEITKITIDMICGKPSTVKGKDADEFRKQLAIDIKTAKENGWIIEIPLE